MRLINKRCFVAVLTSTLFTYSVMAAELFSSVHIQALPNLGVENLGIKNAVPENIWGKSDVSALQALITDITKKALTPAMRDMIVQMMVRQTSSNTSLPLVYRMETLLRLGAFNEVLTLTQLVPPSNQTSDILKLKSLALFLSGQTDAACNLMVKTPELGDMAEDMRLACAVAKGDKTGAELIFATRTENNELDETTVALGQKLFFNNDANFDYQKINERHLHMLGAINQGEDDPFQTLSGAYQKVLSDLPTLPLHIRLEMAEKYNVEQLDKLYTLVDNKTKQNKAVIRAKVYQKIKETSDNEALSKLINEYLELARSDGLFLNLASVMKPFLEVLSPSEKTVDLAFDVVQVFALSNNADLAYPWYKILQKNEDEKYQIQGILLEPLMQQLGAGIPKDIEKAIAFCQKNKQPNCSAFFDKVGNEAFVPNTVDILNDNLVSKRYTPLVQGMLRGLISSERQGEGILLAVKLWQDSVGVEPDIVSALSKGVPVSLLRQLILERYVYP